MFETPDILTHLDQQAYLLGIKMAADPVPSYGMTGLLYLVEHGNKPWLLLSVPNALVRGTFDALHEPGIELPMSDGKLNAHITCVRPEEIELAGGPDAFKNDRGKPFRYSLGRLMELEPEGWDDVEKCWVIRVHSPQLQQMRLSHGLSALPKEGRFAFHITVACLKRGTFARNEKSKDVTAA